MPVIEARAIEFVQQMYAGQPGLYPPRGIEDLEHEISHILLGHPPSHFGESYVSSQWRAGLSLAEGDQQDYNNRKEHFVKWSIKPVRRRRIAFTYNHAAFVDGGTDFSDNNDEKTLNPQIITISSPDSFNELMRGPIGAPTNLGLERQKISAGIFFDRTIRDEVMPVTSKLVERYGGRRPEFDEYPNLRIIIDTEEMKIDLLQKHQIPNGLTL